MTEPNYKELFRQTLYRYIAIHPLPWRLEQDWTWEVVDSAGRTVVSFAWPCLADDFINEANELAKDMAFSKTPHPFSPALDGESCIICICGGLLDDEVHVSDLTQCVNDQK